MSNPPVVLSRRQLVQHTLYFLQNNLGVHCVNASVTLRGHHVHTLNAIVSYGIDRGGGGRCHNHTCLPRPSPSTNGNLISYLAW